MAKGSYRYIKFFKNTKQVGTCIVHGKFLRPVIDFTPYKDESEPAEVEILFSNSTPSDDKGKSNRLRIHYVT